MSNPFEWLDTYELEKVFSEDDYSDFADYYSEYAKGYDLEKWYEYLISLSPLSLDERSKVLDLGCGTGDMLINFIHDGIFVVGVDYSSQMLDAAEDNIFLAFDEYDRYILMKKDIGKFYLSAKFDFIYSMGDTVNYLSPEKLTSLFENVRYMLKKDAVFTFDAINPDHFSYGETTTEIVDIDDETKISFERVMKRYEEDLYLDTHFEILDIEGNVLAKEDHHQRIFTYDEISLAAEKCGLECMKVPFVDARDDSEKIQIVLKVK